MIIIVGLGNPGKKYQNTRHNVGFQAIDEIAANFQFSPAPFSRGGVQSIFNAQISKGQIANEKIILVKPQTFMNQSGKAIKSLLKKISLNTRIVELSKHLWIIHDDIDLPLGKIRIAKNRGSAGHKGAESIIKELGTKNFIRFRIGIKPKQSCKPVYGAERFVLRCFTKEEKEIIKKVIKKTVKAIELFLREGLEKAMNEYNK